MVEGKNLLIRDFVPVNAPTFEVGPVAMGCDGKVEMFDQRLCARAVRVGPPLSSRGCRFGAGDGRELRG